MTRALSQLFLAVVLAAAVPAVAQATPGPASRWIVQLRPAAATSEVLSVLRADLGVVPTHRFSRVLNGFAATLTSSQRTALLVDPRVVAIVPDLPIAAAGDPYPLNPNEVQPGVRRVGAPANADRDGSPLGVDIAVLDTGIQPDNDELNVQGGYNCTNPAQSEAQRADPANWRDSPWFGHGTHVSGIAAARENGRGVAGVAQGARLWAIKVLDGNGNGYWSWVICGLDHVAQMRDPGDPAVPRIEVVNMSLAAAGWDDGRCGLDNADLLHQAVCRLDDEGVTLVAAAGNNAADAAGYVPAAYDEVITVSAMADWNGQAAGSGFPPFGCTRSDGDDAFASFSNYGADVDLIAPGVCVMSTLPTDRLGLMSGTSMATPHVAGGAALYYLSQERAGRPRPTPEQVRSALIARGTQDWQTLTDPDRTGAGAREPALQVADFDLVPGFEIGARPQLVRVAPGETALTEVWVARLGGFAAPVDLSVVQASLPPGASASFADNPITLPASGTTLSIAVPGSTVPGTYQVELIAEGTGIARQLTLQLAVYATSADAGGPAIKLRQGVESGPLAIPVRINWPRVSGARRYELQENVDGVGWATIGKPYRPKFDTTARPGSRYQYRVRAKIGATWRAWQSGLSAVAVAYEPVGGVVLDGAWTAGSIPKAYSELPVYSTQAGTSATLDFSGRSVAWIASRGPTRGRARVLIDGSPVATIDLYAGSTRHRQVVFAYAWASSSAHTIRIEVLGQPTGRPRVDLDALFVISE